MAETPPKPGQNPAGKPAAKAAAKKPISSRPTAAPGAPKSEPTAAPTSAPSAAATAKPTVASAKAAKSKADPLATPGAGKKAVDLPKKKVSFIDRLPKPLAGLLSKLASDIKDGSGPKIVQQINDPTNTQRYLDPAILARLGLNPLVAKLVVEGFISGLHKSPFHGFSVEFADHREYVPGDDLKYLDWFLYARTDNYYIKRYEEETNLRCYILLDRSASMGFGTGTITKWDYSAFLASSLAYMMLKQQDAVGLGLFGSKPGMLVPPRSRTNHLRQLMALMVRNPPQGATDVGMSLKMIVRNLKRRGMIVVISDLIDDPPATLAALRLLASHKHDVVVFHVNDAAEFDFPFEGATLMRDLETGEEIEIDPVVVREAYIKQMDDNCEFYRKGLTEMGIDYVLLNTKQPYEYALNHYLQRRMGAGR